MAAHTMQMNLYEMKEESKHFIEFMKVKVTRKDPCDIINMDQAPISYSLQSSKKLETKDQRQSMSICPP